MSPTIGSLKRVADGGPTNDGRRGASDASVELIRGGASKRSSTSGGPANTAEGGRGSPAGSDGQIGTGRRSLTGAGMAAPAAPLVGLPLSGCGAPGVISGIRLEETAGTAAFVGQVGSPASPTAGDGGALRGAVIGPRAPGTSARLGGGDASGGADICGDGDVSGGGFGSATDAAYAGDNRGARVAGRAGAGAGVGTAGGGAEESVEARGGIAGALVVAGLAGGGVTADSAWGGDDDGATRSQWPSERGSSGCASTSAAAGG